MGFIIMMIMIIMTIIIIAININITISLLFKYLDLFHHVNPFINPYSYFFRNSMTFSLSIYPQYNNHPLNSYNSYNYIYYSIIFLNYNIYVTD